jgi:hypothetical protein
LSFDFSTRHNKMLKLSAPLQKVHFLFNRPAKKYSSHDPIPVKAREGRGEE